MKKKLYFLSTIMIVFLSLFMMTSCGNSSGKDSEIGQSTTTDTMNEKYYTVTLSTNNDNAGTITGGGIYKYGKEITISATTNPGYTFNGWYLNNKLYTTDASFDYEIGASNVTFKARYTINRYKITIDNQVSGVTISGATKVGIVGSGFTSGSSYDYNTEITLYAVNSAGLFLVWAVNENIEYAGNKYSFRVPANDVNITITTGSYARKENKIYCGTYPQTKVTDNTLISKLNTKAGTLPTSSNTYNWTDYNYYIEGNVTSFMYYQDIDYDNNGTYDYRGVYFTRYRPINIYYDSSTDSSCQENNGYTTNTIYWFSYDPIEWDILTEEDGKALIIANLVLDSQDYYPSSGSGKTFSHNGGTGYASNYELSNIRIFLNDNFYNTAFNDFQKSLIETTTVDNSASSLKSNSSSYACNNTNDKMFLLSYKEATTYYLSATEKYTEVSDYAKCQGLDVWADIYSCELLRSPLGADGAFIMTWNGGIEYYYDVYYTEGVRPACWINL